MNINNIVFAGNMTLAIAAEYRVIIVLGVVILLQSVVIGVLLHRLKCILYQDCMERNESRITINRSRKRTKFLSDSNEIYDINDESMFPQVSDEDNAEHELYKMIHKDTGKVTYVTYVKSFTAKLIQSSEQTKGYYTKLKNELLSYKKVKSKVSWSYDSFNTTGEQKAKLAIRGRSLLLYLALNPDEFDGSKYLYEDKSDIKRYEEVPMRVRVKSEKSFRYALELIDLVMKDIKKYDTIQNTDYSMPYQSTGELIKAGLIKVISDEDIDGAELVPASFGEKIKDSIYSFEADRLLTDESAELLVRYINRPKSGQMFINIKEYVVNTDTISEYFEDGDIVNVSKLIAKGLVPKRAQRIRVLDRGALDKSLKVVADSYSLEAIKMIVIMGGKAIKYKK